MGNGKIYNSNTDKLQDLQDQIDALIIGDNPQTETNRLDIADHETRIDTLETNGGGGTDPQTAINTADIATNSGDIVNTISETTTNSNRIDSNDLELANHETRIGTLETNSGDDPQTVINTGNIATNAADILANTGNISTNTTGVLTNAAGVGQNGQDIASNDLELVDHENRITTLESNGGGGTDPQTAINTANIGDMVFDGNVGLLPSDPDFIDNLTKGINNSYAAEEDLFAETNSLDNRVTVLENSGGGAFQDNDYGFKILNSNIVGNNVLTDIPSLGFSSLVENELYEVSVSLAVVVGGTISNGGNNTAGTLFLTSNGGTFAIIRFSNNNPEDITISVNKTMFFIPSLPSLDFTLKQQMESSTILSIQSSHVTIKRINQANQVIS